MIGNMTPEQRAEVLEKAKAARIAKKIDREANAHLLKQDFLDEAYWRELASKYGVRMPPLNEPCSVKGMRKYLRKAGVNTVDYCEVSGDKPLQAFITMNPTWPLLAWVGTMLELKEEGLL